MHLLAQEGRKLPDDYYQSFLLMGEHGILSKELTAALAPSAGLRNRLVHEYEVIDDAVVIKAVRLAQDLYPQYVAAIERHLTSKEP
jgi:uncharacterized protein YutE (UPF0331/DUF86 family)